MSVGSTFAERTPDPPAGFPGPGIVKIVGKGSANNMDVSAGFDCYLVDNSI